MCHVLVVRAAAAGANILVFVLPHQFLDSLLDKIAPVVTPGTIAVSPLGPLSRAPSTWLRSRPASARHLQHCIDGEGPELCEGQPTEILRPLPRSVHRGRSGLPPPPPGSAHRPLRGAPSMVTQRVSLCVCVWLGASLPPGDLRGGGAHPLAPLATERRSCDAMHLGLDPRLASSILAGRCRAPPGVSRFSAESRLSRLSAEEVAV